MNLSSLARTYAASRRDADDAWNGACAAARHADLRVNARDTEAGREVPGLEEAAARAWSALVSACPGGAAEAAVRADHYLARRIP